MYFIILLYNIKISVYLYWRFDFAGGFSHQNQIPITKLQWPRHQERDEHLFFSYMWEMVSFFLRLLKAWYHYTMVWNMTQCSMNCFFPLWLCRLRHEIFKHSNKPLNHGGLKAYHNLRYFEVVNIPSTCEKPDLSLAGIDPFRSSSVDEKTAGDLRLQVKQWDYNLECSNGDNTQANMERTYKPAHSANPSSEISRNMELWGATLNPN